MCTCGMTPPVLESPAQNDILNQNYNQHCLINKYDLLFMCQFQDRYFYKTSTNTTMASTKGNNMIMMESGFSEKRTMKKLASGSTTTITGGSVMSIQLDKIMGMLG